MERFRIFIWALVLVCGSLQLGNSQYSIGGKVVDAVTGEPIIIGSVALYYEGVLITGTDTDFDGLFLFTDLKAGSYSVEASYVGYTAQRIEAISLKDKDNLDLVIRLNEGVLTESVCIVGYKVPLVEYDNTTQGHILNSEVIGEYTEPINRENYSKPEENKFISPVEESHSTFSLDVDKASYSNVRRFINNGQLPPPAAVRVEELINYFDYDYAQPKGAHPIAVKSSIVTCPWNKKHQLLHLSVKAVEIDTRSLPPSNFVFLLDVSGSMRSRLPLVKESFKLLLDKLRPQDRVAIVTYAGSDRIALPSTTASDKKIILQSLENLKSGGSTAGAQGILTAYKLAEQNFIKGGNNRVILATDGDFNVGVSSSSDLEQLITQKRETGVFLSVLGFGQGNYQDDQMQTLANKGNGNHAYIDNIKEAKKVFVNEFSGTLFTVAKDVKIQIEFNPAYVQSYRLVGYENRLLAKEDFNDDKKDAGEVGAGHTVTAIYEIIPEGSDSEFASVVSEKMYSDSRAAKQASRNGHLGYIKCRYKKPSAEKSISFDVAVTASAKKLRKMNKDVQFSIAVAEFGMKLSKSKYLKNSSLENCIKLTEKNLGKDVNGYRSEFLELVKKVSTQDLVAIE